MQPHSHFGFRFIFSRAGRCQYLFTGRDISWSGLAGLVLWFGLAAGSEPLAAAVKSLDLAQSRTASDFVESLHRDLDRQLGLKSFLPGWDRTPNDSGHSAPGGRHLSGPESDLLAADLRFESDLQREIFAAVQEIFRVDVRTLHRDPLFAAVDLETHAARRPVSQSLAPIDPCSEEVESTLVENADGLRPEPEALIMCAPTISPTAAGRMMVRALRGPIRGLSRPFADTTSALPTMLDGNSVREIRMVANFVLDHWVCDWHYQLATRFPPKKAQLPVLKIKSILPGREELAEVAAPQADQDATICPTLDQSDPSDLSDLSDPTDHAGDSDSATPPAVQPLERSLYWEVFSRSAWREVLEAGFATGACFGDWVEACSVEMQSSWQQVWQHAAVWRQWSGSVRHIWENVERGELWVGSEPRAERIGELADDQPLIQPIPTASYVGLTPTILAVQEYCKSRFERWRVHGDWVSDHLGQAGLLRNNALERLVLEHIEAIRR